MIGHHYNEEWSHLDVTLYPINQDWSIENAIQHSGNTTLQGYTCSGREEDRILFRRKWLTCSNCDYATLKKQKFQKCPSCESEGRLNEQKGDIKKGDIPFTYCWLKETPMPLEWDDKSAFTAASNHCQLLTAEGRHLRQYSTLMEMKEQVAVQAEQHAEMKQQVENQRKQIEQQQQEHKNLINALLKYTPLAKLIPPQSTGTQRTTDLRRGRRLIDRLLQEARRAALNQ